MGNYSKSKQPETILNQSKLPRNQQKSSETTKKPVKFIKNNLRILEPHSHFTKINHDQPKTVEYLPHPRK